MANGIAASERLSFVTKDVYVGEVGPVTLEKIRHDVERLLASVEESPAAGSELSYIFIRKQLCMLGCQGTVLSPTTIATFEADLRDLTATKAECPLSSSPYLRMFVKGSFRDWGKDDVPGGYYYVVAIGGPSNSCLHVPTINIELGSSHLSETPRHTPKIAQIDLTPGRVIVHGTTLQYKISSESSSADPAEGLIFVDGYIW